MEKTSKMILVTGATGRQGGAVARHLLSDGWNVRALTRDADKPAARELARAGAEIAQGDMNDRHSLDAAIRGAYGCFSVQNFWESGMEDEIKQGKLVADAALSAGVRHFVYSSVGGAERKTRLMHFESKFQIEQYVRSLGLFATILRPVFFMENFSSPDMRNSITQGTLSLPMKPDRPLQMVSVEDIGAFATLAFDKPDEYQGTSIELASDEMTMPEAASLLTDALGHDVVFQEIPIAVALKSNKEYGEMFQWFNAEGYQADILELRRVCPSLLTFEVWLKQSHYAETLAGVHSERK